MSNTIRYDSLLIRYLAAELEERLRGRRLLGLSLDPGRRAVVFDFEDQALSWLLHPMQGGIIPGRAPISPEPVNLARRSQLWRVSAPPDERIIVIDLRVAARRPGRAERIVVELLGNQWNLIALDPDERIVGVLWRRRAGSRELRPGSRYIPPPASERRGASRPIGRGEWIELLGAVEPSRRRRRLIEEVAYLSPINVVAVLGDAGVEGDADLDMAYDRYHALASLPPVTPGLLELSGSLQPYPLPLPGIDDVPCPTLLDAMATAMGESALDAATGSGLSGGPAPISLEALDRLRERIGRLERRQARLETELVDAQVDAERYRSEADLLIAQLHLARRGMSLIELPDWEGGTRSIELDPSLTPSENVEALYDQARRSARAAKRVPALIDEVRGELDRLESLLAGALAGEVEEASVVEAAPPLDTDESRGPGGGREERILPYRRYRTTGGLEVRVGRSGRANDDLTFRHSSPNDIWLHARDVGGAHVILRWDDQRSNPPARDLAEAAILASLHSRARTSGLVAVDWTRRKYVRKPRKSGPGQVVFERGKTEFVEPDPELEERLRT